MKQLFSSMSSDYYQIDHQFGRDRSIMFCSKADPYGMSCLLQCPLSHGGRFYSSKIGVKGSSSPVLVMELLPLWG
jgi:hypothetical protein